MIVNKVTNAFGLMLTLLLCAGCNHGVVVSGSSNGGPPDNSGGGSGEPQVPGFQGPVSPTTQISATNRDGQTFITWNESDNSSYHIYRHDIPITGENLNSATLLTGRWGPLDNNTSVNVYGSADAPDNFVITPLGSPLSDEQGLFVHTTQEGQQGDAYYAITTVSDGAENRNIVSGVNATNQPVFEIVTSPNPVLTVSLNDGRGRLYTQYMDYANWNPTLNGYAFNFAVALPADYDGSAAYPLMINLHAWGQDHKFLSESEWLPVIQIFPSDPGSGSNTINTWWYGHAADHNYKTQGPIPSSGTVQNFTEQRVIDAINFVIRNDDFNINPELVHMYGGSMGGSGVLAFGMRYPSLFAGVYANQPMTNYRTNPIFQDNFIQLWGEQSSNLSIVNAGANASDISKYDMNGSDPTSVWDWMNHQEQLRRRKADRFSFLMIDHGKLDSIIDWATQGRPMPQVFTDARVGFTAAALGESGHTWLNFAPVVNSVFGLGFGEERAWRYPRSLSFPGIHNASDSGPVTPADTGDDWHNTEIEWSTAANNFHLDIIDTTSRYEITLRSTSINQTADITPRNTNNFRPASGTVCNWSAFNVSDSTTLSSGSASVDESQLLSIIQVPIVTGAGTRLIITCP